MSEIKWNRELKECPARLTEQTPPAITKDSDLRAWLESKAKEHSLRWLLAHADDGVIWGRIGADGALRTSDEAAQGDQTTQGNEKAKSVCPPLRLITLQQARLFGEQAELLLWRDDDNPFRARLIVDMNDDGAANWRHAFDESQLLWGTQGAPLAHGFTLLEDGAQGLRHAVPLSANTLNLPARLRVRHYLAQEDFARVAVSRLVELNWKEN